jgi:hypothetical protein
MEPWKPIPVLLHDVAQLIMVTPPTHLDTTFCVEECWGMLRNVKDRSSKYIKIHHKTKFHQLPKSPRPPERWKPSTSRCWIWWVCHGLSIGLSAQRKDGIPDPCVEDLSHVLSSSACTSSRFVSWSHSARQVTAGVSMSFHIPLHVCSWM